MALDLGPLGQLSAGSAALLGIGTLTLAYIAFTTLRVLLSTFLLPGTSVCSFFRPLAETTDLVISCLHSGQKEAGRSSLVPQTALAKSMLFNLPAKASTSFCSPELHPSSMR